MKIAVLAVQGAFLEHEKMLERLGVQWMEIRQEKDLDQEFDGLILPGGESTVMGKLLRDFHLFESMKEKIQRGLPVLGTCAGLILLAERISNDSQEYFQTLPVTVKRNGYGRQLGSFQTKAHMAGVGELEMTFIRAPYIESVREDAEVLSRVDGKIVGVRYQNQIGLAFHPEVTEDTRVHEMFLAMCCTPRFACSSEEKHG